MLHCTLNVFNAMKTIFTYLESNIKTDIIHLDIALKISNYYINMTYYRILNTWNKTGATCGTKTVYTSGRHTWVHSGFFLASCCYIFSFLLSVLVMVLSVLLWVTVPDYLFCIFKPFMSSCHFSFDQCIACPSIYSFWLPLLVSSNFSVTNKKYVPMVE